MQTKKLWQRDMVQAMKREQLSDDVTLYLGDCLEVMAEMEANSIDSVITDPPYGLQFMGKDWDRGVPGVAFWREALRVAKPGAMLLAMGGTRTFHRLVVAIEDAGWEIRDSMAWLYGSGFPKSYDISKGIDKQAGAERNQVPASGGLHKNRNLNDDGWSKIGSDLPLMDSNVPSTPAAKLWHGWGTALKPAMELICVAMKPIDGTYVNNALTWGVAGLNIDGARVEYSNDETDNRIGTDFVSNGGDASNNANDNQVPNKHYVQMYKPTGRFPANVIHDGSDEVTGLFPQGGNNNGYTPANTEKSNADARVYGFATYPNMHRSGAHFGDSGSAARFFYCAKSSRSERNGGLDGYLTVKYNNDKSNSGGLSWKDVSTVAVQLLRKVMSDTEALSFNIGESGESITALCQKDTLSTTLMAISKTIELKTLHSLTLSLTSDYTVGANYEMANGGNLAESVVSLRKWILTITSGCLESARGASSVALQTLLKIRNADEWSQATNFHSTVKPVALMEYLCKLTKTPTGGVVLDPFMGSGTTGIGCVKTGRPFIGIELDEDYFEIAKRRILHAMKQMRLGI